MAGICLCEFAIGKRVRLVVASDPGVTEPVEETGKQTSSLAFAGLWTLWVQRTLAKVSYCFTLQE